MRVFQVEMVTYGGPHRRLWMGPQFTFRTYMDSPGHSSADLVSPSSEKRRYVVCSTTVCEHVGDRPVSSPVSTPANSVSRSVPVVIEATSVGGFEQGADVTRHVCGSWSDNDYISCDEQEGRLRQTIADAMRDAPAPPDAGADLGGSYSLAVLIILRTRCRRRLRRPQPNGRRA